MKETFDETLLTAYLDGELSDSQRRGVEKHLRRSPEARRMLKELGEVSAVLRSLPREALPEQFSRRVLRAAERETLIPAAKPAVSKRALYWWTGAGSAAAAVFLAVALWPSAEQPLQLAERSQRNETVSHELGFQKPRAAAEQPGDLTKTSQGTVADAATAGEQPAENAKAESHQDDTLRLSAVPGEAAASPAGTREESPEEQRPRFYLSDLKNLKPGEVADALVAAGDDVQVVEVTVVDIRRGVEEIDVLFAGALPLGNEGGINASAPAGLHLVQVMSDAHSFERKLEQLRARNPDLWLSLAINPEVPKPVRDWVRQQTGRDSNAAAGPSNPSKKGRAAENSNHELLDDDWPNRRRNDGRARRKAQGLAGHRAAPGRAKDVPLNVFLLVREPRDNEDAEAPPAKSKPHVPGEQPSLP